MVHVGGCEIICKQRKAEGEFTFEQGLCGVWSGLYMTKGDVSLGLASEFSSYNQSNSKTQQHSCYWQNNNNVWTHTYRCR